MIKTMSNGDGLWAGTINHVHTRATTGGRVRSAMAVAGLACLLGVTPVDAQWSLPQLNVTVVEDFAGFTAPSTWGTANPAANQLDSDIWGFSLTSATSSSAGVYGLNYVLGQGISTGGVGTAGTYAIDTGAGVVGIGPHGDDTFYSPGHLTVKLQNDTGTTIDQLRVEWTYLGFNNHAGRRSSQLLISDTDISNSYVAPGGGEFLTIDNAELTPDWIEVPRDVTFNVNIPVGDDYYLRWSFNDLAGAPGTGTDRDQVGISALSITPLGTVVSDTFEWTNAVSGNFATAGNWTNTTGGSAAPPNGGDTANFNEAGAYTVTFTGDAYNDFMNIKDGDLTFLSDSATLRTYNVTTGLGRGDVSGGTLQVGSATHPVFLNVKDSFNVGFLGDGTVSVVGADSRLDAQGPSHTVGFGHSEGTLNISDDATANIGTAGAGGTLNVGDSPFSGKEGAVNVQSGATLNTGHIDIARNTSGATGVVTVTDVGSSLNQTLPGANLIVGSATGGAGTLNVLLGGTFTTGTGTTTINATGEINLANNGTFNANGPVHIDGGTLDVFTGSPTAFHLDNGLALTATNDAQVKFASYDINENKTFEFNSGADLTTTGTLSVGSTSLVGRGTLIVDGPGTTVTLGGDLGNQSNWYDADVTFRNGATGDLGVVAVGSGDSFGNPATVSTFNIQSGASVTTDSLSVVGRESTATLTVDGIGSQLNQTPGSSLSIGVTEIPQTGIASLDIQNGGAVSTGTSLNFVWANGSINIGVVGDGTLDANGPIRLAGVMNIGDGGDVTAGTISPISNGQINFTGGRFSFDTIEDSLTQTGGVLAPGSSPGTATIQGDYDQQAGGTLEIEVGGLTPGSQHDQLTVTGFATMLGTLDVSLVNGFTPSLGQSFGFLSASGGFNFAPASINLPDITGLGLGWRINPGGATVFLEVIDLLAGDLDGDGFVGINDLNIVLSNWNQFVPPADPLADPSGDGFVGITDLNEVLGNWNAGTPPTAGAVPEPGLLSLITILGALALPRRH